MKKEASQPFTKHRHRVLIICIVHTNTIFIDFVQAIGYSLYLLLCYVEFYKQIFKKKVFAGVNAKRNHFEKHEAFTDFCNFSPSVFVLV